MKSLAYRLSLLLLLAASAAAFMACAGGSGSSGFDISAASEGAAIQRALDERRCLDRKGLTICPANEGVVAAPGTPTSPTPVQTPEIDTTLDHTTSLGCALQPADNQCDLSVQFTPHGFPEGAEFLIAVRSNEANAPWVISPQQARELGNGALAAPLNIPVQGLEIQVAILVFESLPASLPTQVTELVETGADFAYVTHVLMLAPSS